MESLNILVQDDAEHRLFVNELQQAYTNIDFQTTFLLNPIAGKLSNSNPLISALSNNILLLKVDSLPYPLPDNVKILAVLKSKTNKNDVYSLLAKDTSTGIHKIFESEDFRFSFGKVYLVGAGQSDKSLLTMKAHDLIKKADIIFYDSLIDKSILELSEAEKVFVGKRANKHFKDQKDINQLLYDATLKYKTVVRVKGGDPMIFGHAGEEISFLESKLIEVETIPGISSPLGAAAWANLPLTLRNISNSVSFCSAHEKSKILVPNTDTIVYFMGATNLPNIAKTLKEENKPGTFPLTLFYNIGAKDQKVYYETIDSILDEKMDFKSPLLIVAGEVGNRNNWYKSFHHKPKILFTGSHIAKYADMGYVYHQAMIEISTLEDTSLVEKELSNLNSYDWIVFTSMYAVDHFFMHLHKKNKDARVLSKLKIASIGKITSGRLLKFGIIPDLQAIEESSQGLIKLFESKEIKSVNMLIPRSNLAHNYLPEKLTILGNSVKKLTVYENKMPEIKNKVEVENFDKVIFTSPSGVDNFMKVYGKLPQKPEIISRGKETLKRINSYK